MIFTIHEAHFCPCICLTIYQETEIERLFVDEKLWFLKVLFQEDDDCLWLYLKLRSSNLSWQLPRLFILAQCL